MNQLLLCDNGLVYEVAPLCLSIGAGIEVQAFHDPRLLEQEPEAIEKHQASVHDIQPISMHGCFGDLCPGSFDSLVRGVTRMRMEQSYWIASRLGALHLIFHHGYVPHTSPWQGWIKRSVQFWQDFLEDKDGGIHIHLENMLEWDPELISEVVIAVDRPSLDINLDIGHTHCNSKTPAVKWIEQLGEKIGYVHLHDNHGEEDEHLGLGQGNIPLRDACQALNECAPGAIWAIEAEGDGLKQSVAWLGENGFISNDLSLKQL